MSLGNLQRCRICNRIVQVKYTMRSDNGEGFGYFLCECGTIFHNMGTVDPTLPDLKFKKDRNELFHTRYLPIIEEHLYGREVFVVGSYVNDDLLHDRGWIVRKEGMVDLIIVGHIAKAKEHPISFLKELTKRLRTGGLLFIAEPDTSLCLAIGYKSFENWGSDNKTLLSMDRMVIELIKLGYEPRPLLSIQNLSKRFLHSNDFHLIMRKGMINE